MGARPPSMISRILGLGEAAAPRQPTSVALPGVTELALYVAGRRQPAGDLSRALTLARRSRDGFIWLDLHQPTAETMATVGLQLDLPDLLAASAAQGGHRPGVERFGQLTVVTLRTARYVTHAELTPTSEVVDTGAVLIMVGDHFVVTARHGAGNALAALRADVEQSPSRLALGPWSIAHEICSDLTNQYLRVAAQVDLDLEHVEETTFHRERRLDVAQVYQIKREIVEFRRAVVPLVAPLRSLIEQSPADLPERLREYFMDVSGRLGRAADQITSFDELLNSVLQARLAQVTVEQNHDMRRIAAWAAIAATQTFIAGIYGMNFEHIPELSWRYGYYLALLSMATVGVVMYRLFRRSGWL
ncbi:magnesium/cobalt transporter CorA [Pilimelia columellifera subsp. columellifera]|uniref:Magnesium/cobalt transporter CorA n=2 Tax=Pilimelia TaxID=53370 RepID=A0ABP6AN88_9ACTN